MIARLAARFAAWMRSTFPGGPQATGGTDGGYWGGVFLRWIGKAKAAAATMFLRR